MQDNKRIPNKIYLSEEQLPKKWYKMCIRDRHGIALVGHGRRTDLLGLERFIHFLQMGEQANIVGEFMRTLGNAGSLPGGGCRRCV